MLIEIRSVDVDSIDLDDAVAALAVAKMITAEYTLLRVPAPAWLTEKLDELQRNVKARHRDYLERALKVAKQKRDAFKTREEKAADVNAEIAHLEAALQGG